MTAKPLKCRRTRTNATPQPKLIYVICGKTFTSALVLKETPQGWLARRRAKDHSGDIWLESPQLFWKRDLGSWVWIDSKTAEAAMKQRGNLLAPLPLALSVV